MDNNEFFISINDVAKRLSVPAHTLRYWEKQFSTAIRPITGAGGSDAALVARTQVFGAGDGSGRPSASASFRSASNGSVSS